MSDSAGIYFTSDDSPSSPTLIGHWAGDSLDTAAEFYLRVLSQDIVRVTAENKHHLLIDGKASQLWPIERGEPATLMVDFIRYLFSEVPETRIKSDWHLEADGTDYETDHGIGSYNLEPYLRHAIKKHQEMCDTCIVGKEVKEARVGSAYEGMDGRCEVEGCIREPHRHEDVGEASVPFVVMLPTEEEKE